MPPVPPRPPKRGILKGSRTNLLNASDSNLSADSRALLMRNTLQNEMIGFGSSSVENIGLGEEVGIDCEFSELSLNMTILE